MTLIFCVKMYNKFKRGVTFKYKTSVIWEYQVFFVNYLFIFDREKLTKYLMTLF